MSAPVTRRTERLLLRPWRDSDRAPFAAMNCDPDVIRYLQGTRTARESDQFAAAIEAWWADHGWGLFALEIPSSAAHPGAPFIGFTGLWPADFVGPGVVEVGWRLAHDHWGHGYAPEAAREALRFGFEDVGLREIVSFTVPQNENSQRVMKKIGLRRDPTGDFDHPKVDPEQYPELVGHVFYRLTGDEWRGSRG